MKRVCERREWKASNAGLWAIQTSAIDDKVSDLEDCKCACALGEKKPCSLLTYYARNHCRLWQQKLLGRAIGMELVSRELDSETSESDFHESSTEQDLKL